MLRVSAIALASAVVLASADAAAGAAFGEKTRGRVVEESVLVVWSAGREHLFVSATVEGVERPASYVFSVPLGARAAASDGAAGALFAKLVEGRTPPPLPYAGGASPRILGAGGGRCEEGELPCPPPTWMAARAKEAQTFAALPVVAPAGEPARAPWVHLELDDAPSPFAPFSEPPDPRRDDGEPPLVDETHPARVGIWVELGLETKSGAWERQMDAAAERLAPALGDCYAPALAKRRKLSGDVHAQMRVDVAGHAAIDGTRASSPALARSLRCFELALEQATWPKAPGPRAAPFEVHATLRPPSATARMLRIYLLTSAEIAPHVGSAADPRVPPDTRTLVAREPERAELAAIPEATRAALGIDLALRWRLLVLESTADPRPSGDDLFFRTVTALPPPKVGETPLPEVTREDRPEGATRPARPHRWKRRAARLGGAVLLTLLVGLVLWREQRRASAGDVA